MIDLRSDTVTRPTPEMREAMARAVVGDDVLGDDPTVKELEATFAATVGKEAALFLPSGTMGNLLAVLVQCRPGDELVMEERTHTFQYEGAGASRFGGVSIRTFTRSSGIPEVGDVARCLRNPDDVHQPRTRMLIVENTHNMAGGRAVPLARVRELADFVHERGLLLHVDGARLFNAAEALGDDVADLAAPADTVQCCLSKGLGAPIGSLVAGGAAFVREARRARKALGGAMRQVGVIAAAGLLALRDGPRQLARDHANARRLGAALAALPGLTVDVDAIDSNIVMADVAEPAAAPFVRAAREHGVLFFDVAPRRVRFVLHRDVSDGQVDEAVAILTRLREEGPAGGATSAEDDGGPWNPS